MQDRRAALVERARATAHLLQATYHSWRADRAIRLGAGLAYYAVFALAPLLVLSVALAGLVFSQQEVQAFVVDALRTVLGPQEADAVATQLARWIDSTSFASGLGVVGGASMMLAASLVFLALEDAFNIIWDIPVAVGMRLSLRRRAIAFGAVLLSGVALVAAVAIQAVVGVLSSTLPLSDGLLAPVAWLLDVSWLWIVTIPILTVLLRLLSQGAVSWRQALIGAAVTAVFLWIGTWAIGSYLRNFGARSASGAAGAIVLVLLWFYYESQIVLAGAELTKTLGQFGYGVKRREQ